jgi:hypothetical protein
VQPQSEPPGADTPAVDWKPLFAAAGLDQARFSAARPQQVPEVAMDAQFAWIGRDDDNLTQIQIEAASWRGHRVLFRVFRDSPQQIGGLGSIDLPQQGDGGWGSFYREIALGGLSLLLLGALIVAYRNLRQGRSDKRGGYVILFVVLALGALDFVFRPNHIDVDLSNPLLVLGAAVSWLAYIATEPYVRRHWPDSLISWSRLCSGKLANPLVASHVLASLLVAEIWGAVASPVFDSFVGYSTPLKIPSLAAIEGLQYSGGVGELISFWAGAAWGGIAEALAFLIAVVLLRLAIRRLWIADFAAAVLLSILVGGPRLQAAMLIVAWLGFMWLLRRFGLLPFLAVYVVERTLVFSPLGISGWLGARFLPVHLLPTLVGAWALWVILSDKRAGQAPSVV